MYYSWKLINWHSLEKQVAIKSDIWDDGNTNTVYSTYRATNGRSELRYFGTRSVENRESSVGITTTFTGST